MAMLLPTTMRELFNLFALTLITVTSQTWACPNFCICDDLEVTCTDFNNLDFSLLPSKTETLVLRKGLMETVPPAFFSRTPNLKSLELTSFQAHVVNGGAFRGVNNLEKLIITDSSFNIVEPDGFSGMSHIKEFYISGSYFGRVGKHAFAKITDVTDWKIWDNYFNSFADEVFYGIETIHAIQLYMNNISYIGHDIFANAKEVDYVNLYANTINVMSNGSMTTIKSMESHVSIHANKFQCLCENAWMTHDPQFERYRMSNQCFFSSDLSVTESIFRIADISESVLCPETSEDRQPTTTWGTVPALTEDVEIWSDHEGLNPEPIESETQTVKEQLFTGNVSSVNDSLHELETNLNSSFDYFSPENSLSADRIASVDETLSSSALDFSPSSVDSSTISKSTSVSESSIVPEITSFSESSIVPENTYVSDSSVVPEITTVSESSIMPEITSVSESSTVPEITSVSESSIVPENTYVSESSVAHGITSVSESSIVPENTYVSESSMVPETTSVSESYIVPEHVFVTESSRMPESDILSGSSQVPESTSLFEGLSSTSQTTQSDAKPKQESSSIPAESLTEEFQTPTETLSRADNNEIKTIAIESKVTIEETYATSDQLFDISTPSSLDEISVSTLQERVNSELSHEFSTLHEADTSAVPVPSITEDSATSLEPLATTDIQNSSASFVETATASVSSSSMLNDDASIVQSVEDSSEHFDTSDSIIVLSHEFSSLHGVETSEPDSSQSSDFETSSISNIPSSSSRYSSSVFERKTSSETPSSGNLLDRLLTTVHSSDPEPTFKTDTLSQSSPTESDREVTDSSFESSTQDFFVSSSTAFPPSSPSSPVSSSASPSVPASSDSILTVEIFTSPTDTSEKDVEVMPEDNTQEEKNDTNNVSILSVIATKSTPASEAPTATFTVEVPFELPQQAKISSVKDKSVRDKAERENHIYARPYSTSAMDMITEEPGDSAPTTLVSAHCIIMSTVISIFMLFRNLL